MDLVRQCIESRRELLLVWSVTVSLAALKENKQLTDDDITIGVPLLLRVAVVNIHVLVAGILIELSKKQDVKAKREGEPSDQALPSSLQRQGPSARSRHTI